MTLFETIKPFSPEGIFFKLSINKVALMPIAAIEIIIMATINNLNGSVFIVTSLFLVLACLNGLPYGFGLSKIIYKRLKVFLHLR